MPSRHDLPNYLPSPARRAPTQEFDYQELVADPKFHAVIDEHTKNGSFTGLDEGSTEYNMRLKEIAVAFVAVVNEKRATLFRNRGILNGRRGAFREAISCYNRALELSNNSPSKHVTLANRSAAYIKSQKFAEALEDAQEAAQLCSTYSIAHSLMGYCHSRLGMGEKAVVNYNIALQLNPADVSSQGLLAEVKKSLISAGETVETIEALEAPFVAKREQEAAAIQAAVTAAQKVPAMSKRCIDSAGRAEYIQEMVRKAERPIDAGAKPPQIDLARQNSTGIPSNPKKGPEKQKRLSRKLSLGSAQAFASLTKMPGKLKHALGKKNRGSSSLKGYGPGQQLGSDFPGLYQNVVEDAAGAPVPTTCEGSGSALAAPQASAADTLRRATNPLFCADRHRHDTSASSGPGGRNASSVGGVTAYAGNICRAPAVFCTTKPSADGPVAQASSSGSGGAAAVPARGDVHCQRRQHQERPPKLGLPPETPPRIRRVQSAGEQQPGAQVAVAWLQERSRRNTKDGQDREGRRHSADATQDHSGGGATSSLTPPSAPEDNSEKPPSYPPAPRLGRFERKTLAKVQTAPQPDPQQKTPTVQKNVRTGIGPGWAPEKSGYISSESDFSECSPMRSTTIAAKATGSGGEDRGSSALPNPTTKRDQTLGTNAVTEVMATGRQRVVERSIEEAGGTTSGAISGDVSRTKANESTGDRVRLDVSATTEILLGDEEGIAADRALRRVLDGDSDCGSVYESVAWQDGLNAEVEGEKEQAATTRILTPRMESPPADAHPSRGKRLTQSLEDGATAHDQPLAGRESSSAKGFTQSLGESVTAHDRRLSAGNLASSMFADAIEPENFARLSVSVRAKIEMFERTARSFTGEKPKFDVVTGRAPKPRRSGLSRSFSEKVRAHESAISAATTSRLLPVALRPSMMIRSQSCLSPCPSKPTSHGHGDD